MTPNTGGPGSATVAAERVAPAFRVRGEHDAPLNGDVGWAAPLSGLATIAADRPFRLRLEVAPPAGLDAQCLRLEYRRNDGAWLPIEAHDFPYPSRRRELAFGPGEEPGVPDGWRAVAGAVANAAVVKSADEAFLRVRADDAPHTGLHPSPWNLEGAFEFVAEYRVAAAGARKASLVFGYVDPQHHWRLDVDAGAGRVRVLRVDAGVERVLAEHPVAIAVDAWHTAAVQLEAGRLEFALDDALEFTVAAVGAVPAAEFGFHVPAGAAVDFRRFVIEGEPRSPRASIVATTAYPDAAPTADLLPGIGVPQAPGRGVNAAECALIGIPAGHHAEIEWPLVIRRFADGAATNETGDVFAFRLIGSDGRPVAGTPTPTVTLDVPAGHLGGTFVETPGRIGPWRARNGDLYFVMEPAESDNLFMMVKSSDGGRSWREVDGAHRPATGDLESVDGRLVGDTIHVLHQVTEATRHHAFRTSDHPSAPDTWAITDELATEITARAQMASLVARPDGSLVAFHTGDTLGYAIRSPAGAWSAPIAMESGGIAAAGPQAVLGAGGIVHLAYYRLDGTIWHRRLRPDGTLEPAQPLAAGAGTREDDFGPVLPLVYRPESDTLVVVYRLADGRLRERRIRGDAPPSPAVVVANRSVVQNAVDSQQAGADAAGWERGLVVAFIDESDRSLHATVDRGSGWEPATLQVGGIDAVWVRGDVYRRADGALVYGYVYDAGSRGGAGMNRYGELVLEAP